MTNPKSKNLAVSIKARLLNLARSRKRPYQEILQYFGMERFLYRLSKSSYSERFVLKGALLFHVWKFEESRATRDIDMLAKANNSPESITHIIKEICNMELQNDDGVRFDPISISAQVMQSQREYEGIRVRFQGNLEKTKIPMQVDFGFGDLITPAPVAMSYPTLLDLPEPYLQSYPVETVIAEKLHTMAEKGMQNSRVKDYYDVWILLRKNFHDLRILANALENTFRQRQMELDFPFLFQIIEHYGSEADRQVLWDRYLRQGGYEDVPQDLKIVCKDIVKSLQYLMVEV